MANEDVPGMIKRLRTALNLSQEQFAVKVEVTFSAVNRWENSKGKPSPLAMKQIEELRKDIRGNVAEKGDHK